MINKIYTVVFFFLFLLLQGCATTSTSTNSSDFVDLNNGIFQVSGSGLMWQKERSHLLESKEEALQYVESLELGGFNDWRLPNPDEVLELHNIIDFGKAKEGDQGIFLKGNYWCALNEEDIVAGSWQDGDSCEITREYFTKMKGYVRAVRP